MENTTKQRRSSIKIMGKMIGLVKPLEKYVLFTGMDWIFTEC